MAVPSPIVLIILEFLSNELLMLIYYNSTFITKFELHLKKKDHAYCPYTPRLFLSPEMTVSIIQN